MSSGEASSTSFAHPVRLKASPISVMYQESDLSLFTTYAEATTTSSVAPRSRAVITPSATSSQPAVSPTSASPGPALSVGAKAGIGVSAGLAGLFAVLGALLYALRRRGWHAKGTDTAAEFGKPELPGESIPPPHVEEMDGEKINEGPMLSQSRLRLGKTSLWSWTADGEGMRRMMSDSRRGYL